MDHEFAAPRIASWYGDAQLIFLLRHPAARAVSNYFFSRRNGLERLPMSQAFAEEGKRRDAYDHGKISTSPFAYLERGHYINRIRVFERHFERKQMLVLIQEEVVGNVGQVQALYRTLGVDAGFVPPSIRTIVNSDDVPGERPGAGNLGLPGAALRAIDRGTRGVPGARDHGMERPTLPAGGRLSLAVLFRGVSRWPPAGGGPPWVDLGGWPHARASSYPFLMAERAPANKSPSHAAPVARYAANKTPGGR